MNQNTLLYTPTRIIHCSGFIFRSATTKNGKRHHCPAPPTTSFDRRTRKRFHCAQPGRAGSNPTKGSANTILHVTKRSCCVFVGRWHWHHEHHVCLGDRACERSGCVWQLVCANVMSFGNFGRSRCPVYFGRAFGHSSGHWGAWVLSGCWQCSLLFFLTLGRSGV